MQQVYNGKLKKERRKCIKRNNNLQKQKNKDEQTDSLKNGKYSENGVNCAVISEVGRNFSSQKTQKGKFSICRQFHVKNAFGNFPIYRKFFKSFL